MFVYILRMGERSPKKKPDVVSWAEKPHLVLKIRNIYTSRFISLSLIKAMLSAKLTLCSCNHLPHRLKRKGWEGVNQGCSCVSLPLVFWFPPQPDFCLFYIILTFLAELDWLWARVAVLYFCFCGMCKEWKRVQLQSPSLTSDICSMLSWDCHSTCSNIWPNLYVSVSKHVHTNAVSFRNTTTALLLLLYLLDSYTHLKCITREDSMFELLSIHWF